MSIFDLANQAQSPSMGGAGGIGALATDSIYPLSRMDKTQYATPLQLPTSAEVISSDYDPKTDAFTGMPNTRFAAGGIASIPRFDGEDGSQVEAPRDFTLGNSDLSNLSYETLVDSDRINALNSLKETDPKQYKIELMNALGESLKSQYNANENYEPTWKQFSELKSADPAQWNRNQLSWLGHQQGWQIGQNRSDRNEAGMPVIQDQIEQSKKSGLGEDEIKNILANSSQSANIQNQNRIIRQQQAGNGPMGMTTQDYLTVAAILGSGAAAAYFGPAMAATGAAEAGGVAALDAGTQAAISSAAAPTYTTASLPAGITSVAPATSSTMLPGAAALQAGGANISGAVAADVAAKTAGMSTGQKLLAASLASKALSSGSGGGGPTGPSATTTTTQEPRPPSVSSPTFNPAFTMPSMFAANNAPPGMYYQPTIYRYAQGGVADLGGYAAGGKLLKGPGDGMSDDIVANIAGKQPARLADGEFVIPADVVSHLGNGSTDAGAKHLYKMMDRIRQARTGNPKQGKRINPDKFLPKG